MQQNLFSEEGGLKKESNNLPLHINKGKAVISKEQQSFNRLTARIKSLQVKIKKDSEILSELNAYFHKKVSPEVKRLGEEKIKLSHLLHEKKSAEKLSLHLKDKLDELIVQLLDDAFSVVEPDEKTRELYAQYNDNSYDEEMDTQKDEMVEMFSDMLFEKTGIRIDPEELKKDNPDFSKLDENMREQFINNQQHSRTKKTKKQLQKEELEKKKEEIKNKSLRGIYLSLVKILHPDKELDENLKLEKEEYMKKVTSAYNNKDLMELLRLEIMWVTDHEKSLEDTPVDTLNIYIQLLKDQVKDLEMESLMVVENPAYANVSRYLFFSRGVAVAKIDHIKKDYIATYTSYTDAIHALEKGNRNRSVIIKCIEDFYNEEMDDDYPDFMFDYFPDGSRKKSWR